MNQTEELGFYQGQNGSHVPTKVENGVVIPKPSQEYDKLDKKKTQ